MSILTFFLGLYARRRRRSYERNWDNDFKVLLKTHEDPYCLEGLELAMLHLSKVQIVEPTAQSRRTLTLPTATSTVEHLLSLLATSRLYVGERNSVPQNFLPKEGLRQRRFDDYFISAEGHVVSIEKIRASLEGRVTQLIEVLRELEGTEESEFAYYQRKLRPLYTDVFFVLQAIHETSFR
jgi:hypothetical protein